MTAPSSLRRMRHATTATALVLGSCCLGLPAAAADTVSAADANSNCTTQSVTQVQDQSAEPWEIAAADPQTLTNVQGSQLTGSGVTVAVIDTGVAQQTQLNVSSGTVLTGVSTNYANDGDGHGTMVASIIAAQQAPGKGMQGIAPGVTLMSVREAGCDAVQGDGNDEASMAKAIDYAVDHGAQIINISQDGYDNDGDLQAAVQNAYSKGVLIVTSAGNQGDRDTTDDSGTDYGVNPRTYPASYSPDVLAVGAVDQYGNVAPFSETGSSKNTYFVGVTAPGVQVGGLEPNGAIAIDDGTSFASPYVAAEAALLMQEHGWQSSADDVPARAYDLMKIIYATASGAGGYDPADGWGEVDIQKALQTPLTTADSGNALVPPGGAIGGLIRLQGAGPLADGAASAVNPAARTVVTPEVAAAVNRPAQNQQRWAFIALGVGLLVALVALGGAAVARDAARRRGQPQS
jgi:membrane-anchored mycosin MYCP